MAKNKVRWKEYSIDGRNVVTYKKKFEVTHDLHDNIMCDALVVIEKQL